MVEIENSRISFDLREKDYLIIRELAYITGMDISDLVEKMLDKWVRSKECDPSVRRYIDKYRVGEDNDS